jgi:hypothetical protein
MVCSMGASQIRSEVRSVAASLPWSRDEQGTTLITELAGELLAETLVCGGVNFG